MQVKAVVRAKETKAYLPLFERIRIAMFFGTPHRGFIVDDILEMIGETSSRNALVKSLEKDSKELSAKLANFIEYSTAAKIKIVSFKESDQSLKLKQVFEFHPVRTKLKLSCRDRMEGG